MPGRVSYVRCKSFAVRHVIASPSHPPLFALLSSVYGRWTWHIEFGDEPPAPPTGHTTIDGSAVDGSPVDGSAVDGSGVHLHDTLNQTILDKVIPTTTTDEIAARTSTGTSPVPDFRYPLILQGAALPSARTMIETCPPDQRQSVLDEIDAMQALGKVLRPLGLLKSLASKAAMGQFFPNHSLPNAPGSAAKQRRDCVKSDSLISTHAAPRSLAPVSEQGRETIARLRNRFKIGRN